MADQPKSQFDRLKKKREKIARNSERRLTLPMPGYGGELSVRFHPLEWEQIRKKIDAAQESEDPDAELNLAADVLASAAECMLMPDESDGDKLKPLHEISDDITSPVRFDDRLAALVGVSEGIDPDSPARSTVKAVIGNDLALMALQNRVFAWFQKADDGASADF